MARIVADQLADVLGQHDHRGQSSAAPGHPGKPRRGEEPARRLHGPARPIRAGLAIGPSLYSNVGYDTRKDFAPIRHDRHGAQYPRRASVVCGAIGRRAGRLRQRPAPGKVNFGSASRHRHTVQPCGPANHSARRAGIELTHAPLQGNRPGHDRSVGRPYSAVLRADSRGPRRRHGRPAAYARRDRAQALDPGAEVPAVAETLPGFEASLHYGLVAPAGTPRPIIDKLNAALRRW